MDVLILGIHIHLLTPRQHTPRITRLTHRRLHIRTKIPTTLQIILNPHPCTAIQIPTPLRIHLAFQIVRLLAVGDVPRGDEEGKGDPGEEAVDGEEEAVVEQDAGESEEGGEETEDGGDGPERELGFVAEADDLGAFEDVEPGEEDDDE